MQTFGLIHAHDPRDDWKNDDKHMKSFISFSLYFGKVKNGFGQVNYLFEGTKSIGPKLKNVIVTVILQGCILSMTEVAVLLVVRVTTKPNAGQVSVQYAF